MGCGNKRGELSKQGYFIGHGMMYHDQKCGLLELLAGQASLCACGMGGSADTDMD